MMSSGNTRGLSQIVAIVVLSVAVVGYFVGLQAPMPDPARTNGTSPGLTAPHVPKTPSPASRANSTESAIPAAHYSTLPNLAQQRRANLQNGLSGLVSITDVSSEFSISDSEKRFALEVRQQNRAFNGAPPTIPHPIDQRSPESCLACHGQGFKTATMRASKMSHEFLENCTQCHIESWAENLPQADPLESTFVGLPAPTGGPRAFPGAPPQIPHATWMRQDCLSCHGLTGVQGIRTTHPWRQNCEQCHTPSSQSEQRLLNPEPAFLPSPPIHPR